jgi:hypothetical protein
MKTILTIPASAILMSWSLMAQTPMPGQTCDAPRGASTASSANVTVKTKANPFQISVNVHCDASGHPNGNLSIDGLIVNGAVGVTMNATTFVRLAANSGNMPTAILTGACALTTPKTGQSNDCQYWISLTQITGATNAIAGPQKLGVVAYKITNALGRILAHGAGQVDPQSGSITVTSRELSY